MIFLFVLVPIFVVTMYALYQWARTRQPTSVESGIDAFRREMSALSPDRAPVNRRPERIEQPPTGEVTTFHPDEPPAPLAQRGPAASPDPGEPRRPGPRRPGGVDPEDGR